jgi:hypothetical protein
MRYRARSLFLKAGIWVDFAAETRPIAELISDLRPVSCKADLVRIGPKGDGGYLLPDDFDDIGGCVSPGVSSECGFDTQIADMGIEVFMADGSVDGPPITHPNFHFTKKYLDTYTSENTVTLDSYAAPIATGKDLILQMDIEGAEYRVIAATSVETFSRFRMIVVEFHDLSNLFTKFGSREIGNAFRKLLLTHRVVHIHPNNIGGSTARGHLSVPSIMEFTFHRKDRPTDAKIERSYPHFLDSRNVEKRPDIVLPSCWWPGEVVQ